jgi:hypothetical protein
VGNLPVMAFDGPPVFRLDLALSKRTRIGDRYNLELKGEAFNLTNTPSFFRGDMDINSTTFGRITGVAVGSRVIQLSARFASRRTHRDFAANGPGGEYRRPAFLLPAVGLFERL